MNAFAPLRILTVDDEPLARRRLRRLLDSLPEAEAIGEAGGCAEAIALAGTLAPDVVLLDIRMRDGDTIFVPKAERVWVVGQVRNPQGVVYEEGMTVFEAIASAGGITEKGSNSRIEIVRIENGQRKSIDAKQTDVLKPGDQVNVRTRRL